MSSLNPNTNIKRIATLTAMLFVLLCPDPANSAPTANSKLSTAPATKGSKAEALILKQTHYFFGNMLVTATKSALRIQNTGSWKFILVAKSPDWKISVYRDDDKVCYQTTLKQFADTGLVSKFLVGMSADGIAGADTESTRTVGDIHIRHRQNNRQVCDYVPLSGRFAPQCRQILFNVLRVPNCGGITLRYESKSFGKDWMTGVDETDKWNSGLTTSSATLGTADTQSFEAPTNYKLVPSMQQVVTSKSSRDANSSGADELMR